MHRRKIPLDQEGLLHELARIYENYEKELTRTTNHIKDSLVDIKAHLLRLEALKDCIAREIGEVFQEYEQDKGRTAINRELQKTP